MISSLLLLLLISLLPHATDACVWRFCSDINYGPPCHNYGVGAYPVLHWGHHKYYSSAHLLSGNPYECMAFGYHNKHFGDPHRMHTFYTNTPNFHHILFNDAMDSVKIVDTYCSEAHFFYLHHESSYGCTACPRGTTKGAGRCKIGQTCSNSDSQCQHCSAGQYSPSAGGGCLACNIGHFRSDVGALGCHQCPLGAYQDSMGSTTCKYCPAGTKGLRVGAISYDNGCTSCPAGHFQSQVGQTSCARCPAGSFQSQVGQAACTSCPAGSYQSQTGQAGCTPCAAGYFQSQIGYGYCDTCAPGSVSAPGSTECTVCPAGTKADAHNNCSSDRKSVV